MPIFHLTLRGPLHQGEFLGIHSESTLDRIPSDSLFAALVATWARMDVDMDAYLQGFAPGETPPFTLTSAFPRAGGVRFYPAPPRLPEIPGLDYKQAKKLRWFSEGVLNQLREGQMPATGENNFLHGKTTWLTTNEYGAVEKLFYFSLNGKPGLWGEQITPRVVVDRVSNASSLFFSGRMTFAPDCGLWFGVRGETARIEAALQVLQDDGLGGLRSTGHGAFDWQKLLDNNPLPDADEWGYSLARFAPRKDEVSVLKNEACAYKLETIHGWCQDDTGHSWRRRAVRMLAEGALLPTLGLHGDNVNVRPQAWSGPVRPVYRVGYAFFIPAGKLVEAT